MNTYFKRIAFCISDQHLIPHGGIGQFAKGFVEMASRLNWKVDIITDKPASNETMVNTLRCSGANFISNKTPLSYNNHTGTFAFSDSINFEKILNFRSSIMQAFLNNIYDMIVCNSKEDMPAVLAFDLNKLMPVVFYTHEESMVFRDTRKFKGVFLESCNEFFNNIMHVNFAFIGTQSKRNLDELLGIGVSAAKLLPMPMPELELLVPNSKERSGILYIGRWEDRKNPEAFLSVIKETGLPAKIITNINGKRKFEARLQELGITNYEIKSGIVGQEKVDFIKSAKIHYNPSLRESYSFTFFECLSQMPCVVLDKSDWITNFDSKFYTVVTLDTASKIIAEMYKQPIDGWLNSGASEYVNTLHNLADTNWKEFLNSFVCSISPKTDKAKINDYITIKYSKFITDLNRKQLAIDDVKSVLTNKSKFNIIYTDNDTYLSKDKNYIPEEENTNSLESLFA